jgi:hypothetical protein
MQIKISALLLALSLGVPALAQDKPVFDKTMHQVQPGIVNHPGVGVLAFLEGDWKSEDSKTEEIWSKPADGAMIGVRKSPGSQGIEIDLTLLQEGRGGTGGRIQSFDSRMINKNREQIPTVIGLDTYGEREAHFFINLGRDRYQKTYRKISENKMVVSTNANGQLKEENFQRVQ